MKRVVLVLLPFIILFIAIFAYNLTIFEGLLAFLLIYLCVLVVEFIVDFGNKHRSGKHE